MLRVIFVLFIWVILASPAAAREPDQLRQALTAARDPAETALLEKKLGDYYVGQDDYHHAAESYSKALSSSRDRFTTAERLQMATYLAWGKRLDEAISETRSVLEHDPGNGKARTQLARFLGWSGRYGASIREADQVLAASPADRDALLVKANALRWEGNARAAIPLYRQDLAAGNDFDARLGLAYALLASGDRSGARSTFAPLKAAYPYQENELSEFRKALDEATQGNLDLRYSYYSDTDHNRLNRYSAATGFWLGNLRLGLNYRHTVARDDTRRNRAEDGGVRVYGQITNRIGAGAAIGLTQTAATQDHLFVTSQLLADFSLPNGTVGIVLAQESFTDTAQLIDNGIHYRTAVLNVTQRLADRLSLVGSYAYRDYSDDNDAHDLQVSPVYTLLTGNPHLNVGYRFRYLNFDHQSGSGYFDPNDFTSHQIYLSGSAEFGRWYGSLEPYGGFQSFRRNGAHDDDLFGGVTGVTGCRIAKWLRAEFNGEFGNYALQTATGFEYYLLGGRLLFTF